MIYSFKSNSKNKYINKVKQTYPILKFTISFLLLASTKALEQRQSIYYLKAQILRYLMISSFKSGSKNKYKYNQNKPIQFCNLQFFFNIFWNSLNHLNYLQVP